MTATFTVSYPDNTALRTEVFTIPMAAAEKIVKGDDNIGKPCYPGSYWENNLAKPYRRARRAKAESVKVYTSGFGTSNLINLLLNIGCESICTG